MVSRAIGRSAACARPSITRSPSKGSTRSCPLCRSSSGRAADLWRSLRTCYHHMFPCFLPVRPVQIGTYGRGGYSMLASLILSLVVAAILIQVAVLSTTIFLHRTATHKALVMKPGLEWSFKFALWLTTGLLTKEWVAVHRKHHAFTDEEGDPHSPALEGFWHVQFGNVYYYMRELKNPDVVERYARDIKEGWWDRHVFRRGALGLVVGTVMLCA